VGRWMVSSDAGQTPASKPVWRKDGRELLYLRGNTLLSVSVNAGATFSFGTPQALFRITPISDNTDFGLSDDAQRILTNELPPTDPSNVGASLIQNWSALLLP